MTSITQCCALPKMIHKLLCTNISCSNCTIIVVLLAISVKCLSLQGACGKLLAN